MQGRHLVGIAAALLLLAAPAALAADLDTAKRAGQIGEQVDGYVGLVGGDVPADVRALAKQVNQGRQARYAEIAAKRGVPVEAVAAQAGAMLVERAGPGEWVRDSTGQWKRK
jgi:uncharacterized protein YdbL (DUF1318 family)